MAHQNLTAGRGGDHSSREVRRPSRADAASVYQIAAALAALGLLQTVPAFLQSGLVGSPAWAKCALAIGLLQVAYAVWIALAPDWSTVWVAALVCVAVTSAYAMVLAATIYTPASEPMFLGLEKVRHQARLWCAAMALLTLLLAYIAGRFGSLWHRRATSTFRRG